MSEPMHKYQCFATHRSVPGLNSSLVDPGFDSPHSAQPFSQFQHAVPYSITATNFLSFQAGTGNGFRYLSNTPPNPFPLVSSRSLANLLPQTQPQPYPVSSNNEIFTTKATQYGSPPIQQLGPHFPPGQLPETPPESGGNHYLLSGDPLPSRELDLALAYLQLVSPPLSPLSRDPFWLSDQPVSWDSSQPLEPVPLSQRQSQNLGDGLSYYSTETVPNSVHPIHSEIDNFYPFQNASPPPIMVGTTDSPPETLPASDNLHTKGSPASTDRDIRNYSRILSSMNCPGRGKHVWPRSSGKVRCPACGRWFENMVDLQRHIETRIPQMWRVCPSCNKKFSRRDKFLDHARATNHIHQDYKTFSPQEFLEKFSVENRNFRFPNLCGCHEYFEDFKLWLKHASHPDHWDLVSKMNARDVVPINTQPLFEANNTNSEYQAMHSSFCQNSINPPSNKRRRRPIQNSDCKGHRYTTNNVKISPRNEKPIFPKHAANVEQCVELYTRY
ncbi:hypothetical protein FQN57_005382 [Myotisia sp. PD_48]|nr:hypothetical protein FQN57_005382 [Myotisia sp. PD_48]